MSEELRKTIMLQSQPKNNFDKKQTLLKLV